MRALLVIVLVCATGGALSAQATAGAASDAALQPKYDFSLSREAKIKLAEGAAPPEISGKATTYALERTGYVKVRDGTNGFTCLVDRQALVNMEPACFDAEGSATLVPSRLWVEAERAKGRSEQDINADLDRRFKSGEFHAPRKGGVVYMMADHVYVLVPDRHQIFDVGPHLMFYDPYATEADLGPPPPVADMPHLIRPGQPDAFIIVHPGHPQAH